MVLYSLPTPHSTPFSADAFGIALRGRRSPTPRPIPTARVGDSDTCHSDSGRDCGCGEFLERGYDPEWQEESS